jgi:hypothetical protein
MNAVLAKPWDLQEASAPGWVPPSRSARMANLNEEYPADPPNKSRAITRIEKTERRKADQFILFSFTHLLKREHRISIAIMSSQTRRSPEWESLSSWRTDINLIVRFHFYVWYHNLPYLFILFCRGKQNWNGYLSMRDVVNQKWFRLKNVLSIQKFIEKIYFSSTIAKSFHMRHLSTLLGGQDQRCSSCS